METSYSALADQNPAGQHKQAAVGFLELVMNGLIDEAYQRYTALDGKHHNPFFRAGFPALQDGMKNNHAQFPEMRVNIKHVVAEGSMVAVHSHILLQPNTPGVVAVHLFRFENGKIKEIWDCGQPVPQESINDDGMF